MIWVPGHRSIFINEMADKLARTSLDLPIVPIMPPTAYVTAARFRKLSLLEDSSKTMIPNPDFSHLHFTWNNKWCPTRKLEVLVTKLRCRVPPLNFYLNRSGLVPSPLCSSCNEPEHIDHFLITCHRFKNQRKNCFEILFRKLGISLNTPNILSFGATSLGHSDRNICGALCEFIYNTRRLPCWVSDQLSNFTSHTTTYYLADTLQRFNFQENFI